jgi:plasmid stability protein
MATLTIRNVPDEVRDRLRVRAAENGRSMEAEVRQVLLQSTAEPVDESELAPGNETLTEIQREFRKYVPAGKSVVDEFLAERRRMWGED